MAVKPKSAGKLAKKSISKRTALGSFMNITDRGRMEETIKHSEEKYRNIVESIHDGYFEIDLAGNFIFFNDALCEIHGYPKDELMGMNNRQYSDKESAKKVFESFNKIYKTGETDRIFDYEIIRKDGTKRQVEVSASLIKDLSGSPKGFRGITRDITGRKCMEEALRHSEERYRTILEEMDDAYFEVDLAGNYTYVNEANCRILKCSKEELLGKNFRVKMAEEDFKSVYNAFSNIYITGKPERNIFFKAIRNDGTTGYAELAGFPLKNQQGEIIGFKGVGRDITERKLMEESLRHSEEKYRNILGSIQEGYFELDLTGKLIFANDAYFRHLGHTREELIGEDYRKFTDEKNAKESYQHYSELYRTGEPIKILYIEAIRKDGTKGIFETSVSLIRDSEGKPIGFQGISRDVTARKQMEEDLRQSEERYRTILEEMEDAYFEVDVAGNFTFVNDAITHLLGYSKEELLAKTFRDHVNKEDLKTIYNIFANIFTTGKPERGIFYRIVRKDGTTGFAEIAGFPLQNQKGEIIGFRGVGRDITARKQMEEDLRQSEERYRTILEEIEEWYFETDLAGNILFFNDAFARALGYSQKELTGLSFRAFVKQEEADAVYKTFSQVYDTGEPIKNFPHEFVRPDGSITFAEFSILPKRDQEGKIFGFRGVGHDITERKRTEQQLNYMATHDHLTGLPNRMLLMDRLKMALAQAKRNRYKLAVMMLDLDHFKDVNDTLGHMVGDQLLKEIGYRLTGLLRQNDTIARLGGDEFIILLPEIGQRDELVEVAGKILYTIKQPFMVADSKINSGTSIGIAIYPDDCQDTDSLLKNADMAMYHAKSHGRNNYQFFTRTNFDQSG